MARKKGRRISDVTRYTSPAARPPSFGDEPPDELITSGTSFVLLSLVFFLVISFAAVNFGTKRIEADLEARSQASLQAAGFSEVDVKASGATIHLSGSFTTDQTEETAFETVNALVGVNSVEGKLWPVSVDELDEIVVTGDSIEINWDGFTATVEGNVASEDRRTFVSDTLSDSFSRVDIEGLTVLEGLVEQPGWLGTTLGLLISIEPSLPAGKIIVDPNGELLVVGGDVEDKDLRNELNAKVTDTATQLGFSVVAAIRLLDLGPTVEEIEELQVDLDALIEGKVVEFETKSFELTEKGEGLLDEILEALRQAPEIRVQITGHTDDRGSEADNQLLSEDRADSVLTYLVANGESADRFDTIGYGESQPKESNSTTAGRARNRRIEFTALKETP